MTTTDYVVRGGRAELERRVRAPMLPPATRALFGGIGVASPARFLHVLGLSAGLGRLEPDGTVLLVEDIQRGPDSCLPDLLRTVGLHDVAVAVDPLPRTVQAWGRAPAAVTARRRRA